MTRGVDPEERVANWNTVFFAVRQELTSAKLRTILAEMDEVEGIAQLSSYVSLARNVMANDRTAAYVAALLTATGIKPAPMDFEDAGEVN